MKIHEKIRKLRKSRGISQAELADLTGMHKGHISRTETGKYQPSIEFLKKLSEALGVTTDYLLDEEVDDFSPVQIQNKNLAERIRLIEKLTPKEQEAIINIIDGLLTKQKFFELVKTESTEE